ncbi:sigma-54-dependent Fis family transcriptional regulator [Fundidesulfovibrio soli]|uniref:sigma-54-dependent Fis family transcriptional regulator n=1 Tax=Fundidesulfovibrio soli TaxID=2922716 RepID=UPI001FAFAB37|nr:sigma-54-dependent Fis family transcriptional regulator [Fundidesulfovibrio soli]
MDVFASSESLSQKFLNALRALLNESYPGRPARDCLEGMLNRLVEAMGYHRTYLELLDLPLKNQRLSLSRGREAVFGTPLGPGPIATGQTLATRQSLIIDNMADHPDFYGRPAQDLEKLAFVCVPVLVPGQAPATQRLAMGVLCADIPKAPPVFMERHRDFMLVAASVVANAALRLQDELNRAKAKPKLDSEPETSSETVNTRQRVIAVSKGMRLVLRQIDQAAGNDSPVLFRGEEGTGKECLARSLHAHSPRRKRPFVSFVCSAESSESMDRTLFGIQKGEASKSTQSKRGLLELAQGGTLFMEDVEELTPEAQQGLLRYLQEGTILRYGSDQPIPLDVRIIAASRVNLEDIVNTGGFLEDLYYALSVVPIYVPPLRDRTGDVLPLAEYFLQEFAQASGKPFKRISTPAIDLISQYHWPDNVQELRSCMERALEQSEEGVIRAYHLPPTLQTAESSNTEATLSFGEAVDQFEKELLIEALKKAKGNMFQAAKDLRESYRIINYKVKKHNIDPKRFTPGKRK